jgi:predicted MPP superfamily phosphohydrolase
MAKINIFMILRALLGLLGVIFLQIYFYKIFEKGISATFSKLKLNKLKKIKRIFIVYANLYLIITITGIIVYLAFGSSILVLPKSTIYDWLVVYPFWIILVIILQTSLIVLLLHLVLFVIEKLSGYKKERRKLFYKANFLILIFFVIYVPARSIYDYHSVGITKISKNINNLPENLEGYKIALIADIQADYYNPKDRLNNFVEKVNNLNPDLVLIAGDIITESPDYIDLAANSLGELKSKDGIFACVGDHDNWAYRSNPKRSLREVESKLEKKHIPMLDNKNLTIKKNGSKILISFITQNYVNQANLSAVDSLSMEVDSSDVSIFLVHQPREKLMKLAEEKKYDLYLCGHTHGGQVVIFFPFQNISPTLFETPFVKGEFNFGSLTVYVNRGLGMSLAPIRYNSTPEITLIQLKRK